MTHQKIRIRFSPCDVISISALGDDDTFAILDNPAPTTSTFSCTRLSEKDPLIQASASIQDECVASGLVTPVDERVPAFIDPAFYDEFEGDWCRYCGSRDTSGWSRGPWGSRLLCIVHYVAWWQKKKLDLSPWPDLPKRPIAPEKNTEFKYKAFKLTREQSVQNVVSSRQKTINQRRKKKLNKKGMEGCEIVLRKLIKQNISAPFLLPVDLKEYPNTPKLSKSPWTLAPCTSV